MLISPKWFNMLLVHIQHFLDKEGNQQFPQWIKDVAVVLKLFEGFLSIKQLINVNSPDESHLLLEFDTEEHFKIWTSSEQHEILLTRLTPYQIQKPATFVFKPSIEYR
jgi:antibiotic biosynthesis monooxygenase (ABM) superfamily enzyme